MPAFTKIAAQLHICSEAAILYRVSAGMIEFMAMPSGKGDFRSAGGGHYPVVVVTVSGNALTAT